MKNDRPPACKIEIFVTINCEFSLSHLNAPLTYLVGGRHKEETLIFELELEGINITHVHCNEPRLKSWAEEIESGSHSCSQTECREQALLKCSRRWYCQSVVITEVWKIGSDSGSL